MRVRATLRLRNEKLLAAREALGLTQAKMAKLADVNLMTLCRLEQMQFAKVKPEAIQRVAQAAELDIEEVCPSYLREQDIPSSMVSVADLPQEKMMALANRVSATHRLPSPQDIAEETEAQKYLQKYLSWVLDKLSFREREIIKLRFGIGDGEVFTLKEIAHIFQISTQRVRQLEKKALKRLRNDRFQHLLQEVTNLRLEKTDTDKKG